MSEKTTILNHDQIHRKIKRIAFEILENNVKTDKIWIGGLNKRGGFIASLLAMYLRKICDKEILEFNIDIQDNGSSPSISVMPDASTMDSIVLVDDVLNSGRTLANALIPFIQLSVNKLEIAVLADRNHRRYPVHADYVGISMATTLQEHITFDASKEDNLNAYLS
jgi:pyrimidine operon attenuation protein/uracil phosphoribosyltransferase